MATEDVAAEQVERLCGRLDSLLDELAKGHGTVQTVVHKSSGMGPWGAAAVCACFMTYLALVLFALWSVFQINNLTAWKDVYGRELAGIKQIQQQLIQQEKPK